MRDLGACMAVALLLAFCMGGATAQEYPSIPFDVYQADGCNCAAPNKTLCSLEGFSAALTNLTTEPALFIMQYNNTDALTNLEAAVLNFSVAGVPTMAGQNATLVFGIAKDLAAATDCIYATYYSLECLATTTRSVNAAMLTDLEQGQKFVNTLTVFDWNQFGKPYLKPSFVVFAAYLAQFNGTLDTQITNVTLGLVLPKASAGRRHRHHRRHSHKLH